jgi:hypothetical protein
MKSNTLVYFVLVVAGSVLFSADLDAQKKTKQHGPPSWAPAHGYRAKTRQVYFPEHNFYYDVQKGVYIYIDGGAWKVGAELPLSFGNIDLKSSIKVELDLNTDTPQVYNSEHVTKYKAQTKEKVTGEKTKPQKEKGRKKK